MSFRVALSGLNAASKDLAVTGNNIANVSTTGFKRSRAEFVDVYAASYQGISRLQSGSGVRVAQIQQQMSQGNVEYTDNNLDLAINGKGFFVLEDNGAKVYSRAGSFAPDKDGYVVNSMRQRLQVNPANEDGSFNTGVIADLQLSTSEGPPKATTEVKVSINLDSEAPVVDSVLYPAFDPADPNTYTYSTSVTVYDTLGSNHLATMYYRKDGANNWNVYTTMTDKTDSDVPVGGDGLAEAATLPGGANNQISGPYNLVFTSTGGVDPVASSPLPFSYSWNIENGAATTLDFAIDYGDSTQYSRDSGVNAISQDGFTTGLLTGIDIDDKGVVFARYTNGNDQALGQVVLASFANPQGLQPNGDSGWLQTFGSGEPLYGEAGSASLGLIQSGALESSNVNLSEELVNLIVAQRNFQANAQTITVNDTITQTIINMR